MSKSFLYRLFALFSINVGTNLCQLFDIRRKIIDHSLAFPRASLKKSPLLTFFPVFAAFEIFGTNFISKWIIYIHARKRVSIWYASLACNFFFICPVHLKNILIHFVKLVHQVFLVKTGILGYFPIIIFMNIKRSSFETEMVFKTIPKERSTHSVFFYYVMSVKGGKFILAI